MKQKDIIISILFAILTIGFIAISMTNISFFNWAFARHQNQFSWYIRPIFIIPFCFFSYRRSLSGISITVFCLFTSMFWFNEPLQINERVGYFLQFEKEWLYGEWNLNKFILILTIPFSFFMLGWSFWKRSIWIGLGVILLMTIGKIIWSLQNAGDVGRIILLPAIIGLVLCISFIIYAYKNPEK